MATLLKSKTLKTFLESAKTFLIKLKAILRFKEISSLLIYITPSIILILLSNLYPILIVLYILYLIYLYKRNRVLFKYSLIISIFILIIYYLNYFIYINYKSSETYTGIITITNDKYFILKSGIKNIKVYTTDFTNINIGSTIKLSIDEFEIIERNQEGTFSYFRYKLSKRIVKEGNLNSIIKVSNNFNIYKIRLYLINYIENNYDINTSLYLKRMILGINEFDESLDNSINNLGIVFLFCISGLHISLLKEMLKKFFRIFNIEEEAISIIIIIILFIYSLICVSSSSLLRAILIIFINELLSLKRLKLPKTDCITISFIILLIYNPFYIFEIGFYLSFLTTSIIYMSKQKNLFKSQIIINLFTIPLILYNSNEVSILIIIISLIFNTLFSEIIIPLTYLTFIFYPLGFIYKYIALFLNEIINILSKFEISLNYSICSIYVLLIIYFYIFYIFRYKDNLIKIFKGIIIILISLSIDFIVNRISIIPKIELIDVGQGDSILLKDMKYNILVDTGPFDKYSTTVSYLKNQNINKIDAIFISHTDSDHYNNLDNITNSIKVDQIIMPNGNNFFEFGNIKLYSIMYESKDDNNSSMILYTVINNRTILLTGDIEIETEKKLINDYNLKIDILKVSHHGSITSTTNDFLDSINPKIALISVGLNNRYNHPSDDVILRLNERNIKTFRTDLNGSIKVYLFRKFYIIKTYKKTNILFYQNLTNLRLII